MKFSGNKKLILVIGVCLILLGITIEDLRYEEQPEVIKEPVVDYVHLNNERNCLVDLLWGEARGESPVGIMAVLSVVENRRLHPDYPSTYCRITYQNKQFSFVRNQIKPKPVEESKYQFITGLASQAVLGNFEPILPSNILHYTHKDVSNYWTRKKKVFTLIGNHKFYTTKRGT